MGLFEPNNNITSGISKEETKANLCTCINIYKKNSLEKWTISFVLFFKYKIKADIKYKIVQQFSRSNKSNNYENVKKKLNIVSFHQNLEKH